jgi:hypothetical protein
MQNAPSHPPQGCSECEQQSLRMSGLEGTEAGGEHGVDVDRKATLSSSSSKQVHGSSPMGFSHVEQRTPPQRQGLEETVDWQWPHGYEGSASKDN